MVSRIGLILAAVAGATAGGCVVGMGGPAIRGSGIVVTEERPVGPFTKFEVRGTFEVVLKPGPAGPLALEGDDNLLQWVESEVHDDTLIVRVKDRANLQPTRRIAVELAAPAVTSVIAHGACRVTAEVSPSERITVEAHGASQVELAGVEADSLAVDSQGASLVVARGRAAAVAVQASGSSKADLSALVAGEADMDIGGASGAELRATGEVRGEVSGASTLTLLGRPASERIATSGASSVSRKEPPPGAAGTVPNP